MTPRQLRNGIIILFLLTVINCCQSFAVLHAVINNDRESAQRERNIDTNMQKANAVINQLCLTMHTPCVYTLNAQSPTPVQP